MGSPWAPQARKIEFSGALEAKILKNSRAARAKTTISTINIVISPSCPSVERSVKTSGK
jgi:hypothetical protein